MRLVRRAAASCQGCGAATRRGSHCADCRPAGAARPSAAKRGYGHRWRQRRDAFLAKHRYCADGCGRLATIVDHVIPKGPPFYGADDESNWQALAAPCHSRKTALQSSGWGRRARRT